LEFKLKTITIPLETWATKSNCKFRDSSCITYAEKHVLHQHESEPQEVKVTDQIEDES